MVAVGVELGDGDVRGLLVDVAKLVPLADAAQGRQAARAPADPRDRPVAGSCAVVVVGAPKLSGKDGPDLLRGVPREPAVGH